MRRVLIFVAVLMFLGIGATAQDFTGQMNINGYLGYSFGFGDAFFDDDFGSFGANFNFGGQFFYGWKENMMVGGELYLQNYSVKIKLPGFESSESDMQAGFLANILYAFNYEDEKAFMGIGGLGIYDGDIGISGGIIYQKTMSENITLFGMPRLHIIFVDTTPMILQLAIGINFPLGGGY